LPNKAEDQAYICKINSETIGYFGDGKPFLLAMNANTTMIQLRKEIESVIGIPPTSYSLATDGLAKEDDKVFLKAGGTGLVSIHSPTYTIRYNRLEGSRDDNMITITVKMPNREYLQFHCNTGTTTDELRTLIRENHAEAVDGNELVLFHQEMPLDFKILYNIPKVYQSLLSLYPIIGSTNI
jgi:hypothetical protein